MIEIQQNQHIECARVYVDKATCVSFRVVCFYCGNMFNQLSLFAGHFASNHAGTVPSFVERLQPRPIGDQATAEELTGESKEITEKFLNLKESIEDISKEANEGSAHEETCCLTSQLEEIAALRVDVAEAVEEEVKNPYDKLEFLKIIGTDSEVYKDYGDAFDDDDVDAGNADQDDNGEGLSFDDDDDDCYCDIPTSEDDPEVFTLPTATTSEAITEALQISTSSTALSAYASTSHQPLDNPDSGNRPFYSLRNIDHTLMMAFIDHVAAHPCLWDKHNPMYYSRDVRTRIATQICVDLAANWNLSAATPQMTRIGIWRLCRWFEVENARERRAKERGEYFSCTHLQYYRRLGAFLPHQQLRWMMCTHCRKNFKTEVQLRTHQYICHGRTEAPYKCRFCHRTFAYPSAFRSHEQQHAKEVVWTCDLCDYQCTSNGDCLAHQSMHRNEGQRYVCATCGAVYKSVSSLRMHERKHALARLVCDICGRAFHENYRLQCHLRWHQRREQSAKHERIPLKRRTIAAVDPTIVTLPALAMPPPNVEASFAQVKH